MTPSSETDHLPQLDGLRALAFLAVAVSHWAPDFLIDDVPWGTGVQLFFVLSGFLITGILLRTRPAETGISLATALKTFYARRVLRIFPLYYGVLAIALLFALGPIRQTWPWHAAYLSNFHYAWHAHAPAVVDPFLHFWSLAVEEQFYLVWPLVALLASQRALPVILLVSIVSAAIFRISVDRFVPHLAAIRYLTPSCLDALAVGGLLAWTKAQSGAGGLRRLSRTCLWVSIAGLAICTVPLARLVDHEIGHRLGHTFLVIFYGAVVGGAALGFGGILGRALTLPPLLYLGKISYGLYVYHFFAAIVIDRCARAWGGTAILQQPALLILAYSLFTLAAAAISWHFYERPINRLKRHFSYPTASRRKDTSLLPSTAAR